MTAAATGGGPDTYILFTILGLCMSGVIAAAAYYPVWRDHRQKARAREDIEERWAATADVVLGCEADPRRGRTRPIIGLDERVDRNTVILDHILKAIGSEEEREGRTISQCLRDQRHEQKAVSQHLAETAERLARHDQILADLQNEIRGQRGKGA